MPAFFRMLEGGMLDEPLFSIWLSPDPTTEPRRARSCLAATTPSATSGTWSTYP